MHKKDYDEARAAANELKATMGDGWRIRVWENGGWCFEVTKGLTKVCTDKHVGDEYRCSIDTNPQVWTSAGTPLAAYRKAMRVARDNINKIEAAIFKSRLEPKEK